jgi:hypothetical protein
MEFVVRSRPAPSRPGDIQPLCRGSIVGAKSARRKSNGPESGRLDKKQK